MKLSSIFLGAALVFGAGTGPGIYHEFKDESQTVRATVTGVVDVPKTTFQAAHTEIHTTQGVFNTYKMAPGLPIVKGVSYDFNLQGAHITPWPPTYTRDITRATPAILDRFLNPNGPNNN